MSHLPSSVHCMRSGRTQMSDIASATLKELCDEAGERIRGMERRRLSAEVVSVRPSGTSTWLTVVDDGDCVDVFLPGGRLSGRTTTVERGMVLDMCVEAKPQRADSGWYCVALQAKMARRVGPVEQHRDGIVRTLAARRIIRRRTLDSRQYAYSIPGVEGARRITALVPPSGRAGWRDVAGQLGHLPEGHVTVVPVGGRGRTMAQGCADFLSNVSPGDADVVAIIRGGGNKAGLAEFDIMELALAIHASPVPVVTAIGHREDVSVADAVAHSAFPTPGQAGHALSLVSGGPGAVRRKRSEAELTQLRDDLSASRREAEERAREVTRLRTRALVGEGTAQRHRKEADEAHQWINNHLVDDAVARLRRRAARLASILILASVLLLVHVVVGGFAPWIAVIGAALALGLAVRVLWGPTLAVTPPRGATPHREWSVQDWRHRVAHSRTPKQLRALR